MNENKTPPWWDMECIECGSGADCLYSPPVSSVGMAFCASHFLGIFEEQIGEIEREILLEQYNDTGKMDIHVDPDDGTPESVTVTIAHPSLSVPLELHIAVKRLERRRYGRR